MGWGGGGGPGNLETRLATPLISILNTSIGHIKSLSFINGYMERFASKLFIYLVSELLALGEFLVVLGIAC